MSEIEIYCTYCENKSTVITDSEEEILYCPICGEDIMPEDEDDYPELDFGEDDR